MKNFIKSFQFSVLFMAILGATFQNPLSAQQVEQHLQKLQEPRVVEDGGTGVYSAIMYTDGSLLTHTIFRPKDLSVFGEQNKLPIIALFLWLFSII